MLYSINELKITVVITVTKLYFIAIIENDSSDHLNFLRNCYRALILADNSQQGLAGLLDNSPGKMKKIKLKKPDLT